MHRVLYIKCQNNLILKTNQFIDLRCKKWGDFNWYSIQTGIQLKRNNVLRNKWRRGILNFKSIPSYSWTYGEVTPVFIKWMTSQGYNNNDALLFPLQNWRQPHQIKCSDQFRVNKQDTDCFEHPYKENTKLSVNASVSYMPEFSYRHQDFYGFYRGQVRSDGTLIEWERDVDVLAAISSPSFSKRRVLLNSRSSNPGEIWKITYIHQFELQNFL